MNDGNDAPCEILDFPDLIKRLEGDVEFLGELLDVFREESPGQFDQLDAGIAASDFVSAERAAHTLKGMLANLSMRQATSTASRVEMAARAHSLAETIESAIPLRAQVEQALQAVEAHRMGAL